MEARAADRPRLGLVLGGGAARGVAHVGVLKVLQQEGIRPDVVVGTSAGALAGAFLAAGISAERAEMWARGLRWSSLARPVVSRLGLMSNERLGLLIQRALTVRTFEELSIPFGCVATDLQTSDPVLLRDGDLISAVRASCAIPGIFVPVERDGRLLIDGGVCGNVPVAAARRLGAEVVVAVDVNRAYRPSQAPGNMLSIIAQAFFAIGRAAERHAADRADLLIVPDVGDAAVDDFRRAPDLVRAGEAAALESLPLMRALLNDTDVEDAGISALSEAA